MLNNFDFNLKKNKNTRETLIPEPINGANHWQLKMD